MKIDKKCGFLSTEIVTALALLTIAVVPIVSLHVQSITHSRQLYYKSIVTEMMNDRIAILRSGGWKEFGRCENKKIAFIGEGARNLPEGNLSLSVKELEDHKNLAKIVLRWEPKTPMGFREIEKETLVFVPSIEGEAHYD